MQISRPCPKCGEYDLYRSHSKTFIEKGLKKILPHRIYRCHSCKWRGWILKKRGNKTSPLKTVAFYIFTIILCFIVASILRIMII